MLDICRFCHTYPGVYWNPAHPTSDGVIPWKTFVMMYAKISAVWSLDVVQTTRGVSQAIATTLGDKNGPATRSMNELIAAAFPESE